MNFYVIDALGNVKKGGNGTVNSVGLVMPDEFSVADSPVTTSGAITVSKTDQNANLVYAGPVSGAAAAPTFRALVADDFPAIPQSLGSTWYPDAPPASPSALDDEFDDASFDTLLWSEFDPSTTVTVSETAAGLILDQPSQSGNTIGGIYQDLPGGDFTICTRLSLFVPLASYGIGGLVLYDDATSPTAGMHTFSFQQRSASTILQLEYFSDYATWSSAGPSLEDAIIANSIYLRIRRNGSDYFFDWSTDGLGWTQMTATLGTTPQHFGVYVNNFNSGMDIRALYSFFRYEDSDVGLTAIMPGQRVSLFE